MAEKNRVKERCVYDSALKKAVWITEEEPPEKPKGVARWPLEVASLSVLPHEAAAYQEDARRHGFSGIEFDKTGKMTVTCPKQYERYWKHRLKGTGNVKRERPFVMLSTEELERATALISR